MNKIIILFSLLAFCAISLAEKKPKTTEISIKQHKLTIEVADTPKTMQRGLMFRKQLDENTGMLFIFPKEDRAIFWMKNTSIPLSIAYIDQHGKILEIYPLEPYNEKSVFSKSPKIRFALEVNLGWFDAHGIKPGDTIQGLPKP